MSRATIPGAYPEGAAPASSLLAPNRHPDLLVYRLHGIARAAGERAAALCRQGFAVSRRQLRILAMLSGGRQRSPSELAAQAGLDKGRMSRTLDELERRSFIQRQAVAGDARRQVLSLTDAGEHLYRALFAEMREMNLGLLAAVAPEDRAALERILAALEGELGVRRPDQP